MFPAEKPLQQKLNERKEQNVLRELITVSGLVDFCSNDYLGFARSPELKRRIEDFLQKNDFPIGSTGSRLISGNTEFAEQLEKEIAEFHQAEAGLIFNSGYDANVGIFSSVPQKGDTIIYDELVHASIHDGIRLSKAQSFPFRHNDLNHLEERLKITSGVIYIAVESVYSMDGDFSPLIEIAELCEKHSANLIVDEAHATGFFGSQGVGRIVELGLQEKVFARMHTFGKAMGCHGSIVLGSEILREYLVNFARAFIYTTALTFHSLLIVKYAYDLLKESNFKKLKSSILTNLFKEKVKYALLSSESPIQCLVIPGNEKVKSVAEKVQNDGFDVRPILSPTVPKSKERLRICLHAFNTENEVIGLAESINRNL